MDLSIFAFYICIYLILCVFQLIRFAKTMFKGDY